MTDRGCSDCPVKTLRKIQQLTEKRALEKLPGEVREPLLEAKKQMRLALRGFIDHALVERETFNNEKKPEESRAVEVE